MSDDTNALTPEQIDAALDACKALYPSPHNPSHVDAIDVARQDAFMDGFAAGLAYSTPEVAGQITDAMIDAAIDEMPGEYVVTKAEDDNQYCSTPRRRELTDAELHEGVREMLVAADKAREASPPVEDERPRFAFGNAEIVEERADDIEPGWVLWASGVWREVAGFGDDWEYKATGQTGPTIKFRVPGNGSTTVVLVETFARDSLVLRRLAAPRDPGVPAAKTHEYAMPPAMLFAAVKAKLHELGLASGDEAVTNRYVEALCEVVPEPPGVLDPEGIEAAREAVRADLLNGFPERSRDDPTTRLIAADEASRLSYVWHTAYLGAARPDADERVIGLRKALEDVRVFVARMATIGWDSQRQSVARSTIATIDDALAAALPERSSEQ